MIATSCAVSRDRRAGDSARSVVLVAVVAVAPCCAYLLIGIDSGFVIAVEVIGPPPSTMLDLTSNLSDRRVEGRRSANTDCVVQRTGVSTGNCIASNVSGRERKDQPADSTEESAQKLLTINQPLLSHILLHPKSP